MAAALPSSSLTNLKCALPALILFCSAPAEHSSCTLSHPAHSLAYNGLTNNGEDMSGVIKLAEALPQSKLQSLKCAAALALACARISSVQGPLNTCTCHAPCPTLRRTA